MNERAMQFGIGMFVIVAGLVMTMLVVWFGESPALFRETAYVTVHYFEAPGVAEGIPVRKSGIRIGEVASIRFDERPNQPDGVLVTLALERKYKLRAGSVPRISRALIGDVSIDMLPGTGSTFLGLSSTPGGSMDPRRIIEGTVAPDPSNALAAATHAFERVGGTLASVDAAAQGIAKVTQKAQEIDQTIVAFRDMGRKVTVLADDFDRVLRENEGSLRPALASFREVSQKLNATLDEKTQANLRATMSNAAAASARFDRVMTEIEPLARDLGAVPGKAPATNFGQTLMRVNRIAYEIGLLTRTLADAKGNLNTNGSLAKLFANPDLHDNLNGMAAGAREMFGSVRPLIKNLNRFAERVANDPSVITRGVLQQR
jgi:phospholipid/cholesterol/gamma-HCH transport system substrate-binding protein